MGKDVIVACDFASGEQVFRAFAGAICRSAERGTALPALPLAVPVLAVRLPKVPSHCSAAELPAVRPACLTAAPPGPGGL